MTFSPFAPFEWKLAHGQRLTLGSSGILMGILNVTPDSFSDGGKFDQVDVALKQAKRMIRNGAHIIDIGGESTRPGAKPVTAKQEQERVLPIIKALSEATDTIISIDTYRAQTADKAVAAGAHIINDVWGFQKDPQIADVSKRWNTGCVLMHSGRERQKDSNPIKDQLTYLSKSLKVAKAAGIANDHIILDPGYGFAKNVEENISLLANMEKLFALGYPILTGTSRKRFVAHIAGNSTTRRDLGTAATTVVARMKGSAVFRVHDVAKNRDALAIADAVLKAQERRT